MIKVPVIKDILVITADRYKTRNDGIEERTLIANVLSLYYMFVIL